jgi:hypothetical protein
VGVLVSLGSKPPRNPRVKGKRKRCGSARRLQRAWTDDLSNVDAINPRYPIKRTDPCLLSRGLRDRRDNNKVLKAVEGIEDLKTDTVEWHNAARHRRGGALLGACRLSRQELGVGVVELSYHVPNRVEGCLVSSVPGFFVAIFWGLWFSVLAFLAKKVRGTTTISRGLRASP